MNIKGIGLSLVNSDVRSEIIYLGLVDSDVAWERMTQTKKFKPLPEQASGVLEKAYQQALNKIQVHDVPCFLMFAV